MELVNSYCGEQEIHVEGLGKGMDASLDETDRSVVRLDLRPCKDKGVPMLCLSCFREGVCERCGGLRMIGAWRKVGEVLIVKIFEIDGGSVTVDAVSIVITV